MDVIWFIAGLVIGAVVGILLGYNAACLSILRKTSVRKWDRECKESEREHDTNE